jgi:hypothetical protein
MNPIVFMLVVLPGWLIKEGYAKLEKYTQEEKWYWKLPYILLFILLCITTVMWIIGVI